MTQQEQNLGVSIAEQMEMDISEHYACVIVKLNHIDMENLGPEETHMRCVQQYLEDCGAKIMFASGGIHLNGKHKIPHMHWHLIMEEDVKPTNPSDHRKRWAVKNGYDREFFKNVSIKYHARMLPNTPRYSTLAYPLKEGITVSPFDRMYLYLGKPMSREYIKFLGGVGKEINDVEHGIHLRREKSDERKQLALMGLYAVAKEHKDKFTTYKGMMQIMEVEYYKALEFGQRPTIKNYSENSKQVAVELGICNAYDFIL